MNAQVFCSSLLLIILQFGSSLSQSQSPPPPPPPPPRPQSQSQSYPPPPLLQVRGKTFYIETYFKANWFRAGEFCRQHGMHLASINNKEENDAILQAVRSLSFGPDDDHYWTSGNDLARRYSFVWGGTGQRLTFQDFYQGQPNYINERTGEEEHCIQLRGEWGFQWNDLPCHLELYFICEKRIRPN